MTKGRHALPPFIIRIKEDFFYPFLPEHCPALTFKHTTKPSTKTGRKKALAPDVFSFSLYKANANVKSFYKTIFFKKIYQIWYF